MFLAVTPIQATLPRTGHQPRTRGIQVQFGEVLWVFGVLGSLLRVLLSRLAKKSLKFVLNIMDRFMFLLSLVVLLRCNPATSLGSFGFPCVVSSRGIALPLRLVIPTRLLRHPHRRLPINNHEELFAVVAVVKDIGALRVEFVLQGGEDALRLRVGEVELF